VEKKTIIKQKKVFLSEALEFTNYYYGVDIFDFESFGKMKKKYNPKKILNYTNARFYVNCRFNFVERIPYKFFNEKLCHSFKVKFERWVKNCELCIDDTNLTANKLMQRFIKESKFKPKIEVAKKVENYTIGVKVIPKKTVMNLKVFETFMAFPGTFLVANCLPHHRDYPNFEINYTINEFQRTPIKKI